MRESGACRWRRQHRAPVKDYAAANRRRTANAHARLNALHPLQPCEMCGEPDIFYIERDHRDPAEKVGHVSDMATMPGRFPDEVLLAEALKTRFLCRNCHRIHTAVTGSFTVHQLHLEYEQAERKGRGDELIEQWLHGLLKRCTVCRVEKTRDEFGKNRRAKDGLHWLCKPCAREAAAAQHARKRAGLPPKPRRPPRLITATDAECTVCRLQKPHAQFVKLPNGTLNGRCRPCSSDYDREYRRSGAYQATKLRRRERNNRYLYALKRTSGCADCGIQDPRCLDAHHTSRKDAEVSQLCTNANSLERLQAEMDLCVILCANCHKRHTHPKLFEISRRAGRHLPDPAG